MLEALSWMWLAVSSMAALLSIPGSVELFLLTAGNLWPRPDRRGRRRIRRVCVVIPAHNEQEGIARCVAGLRPACEERCAEIAVIADNCTDLTAERARSAGARVIERRDPDKRGKGHALDFAFRLLLAERVDAFLVVDADTSVSANFVSSMCRALEAGACAAQCRYLVANPGASRRTRLMNVALLAFNVLRPRGRDGWGLSAGILGNGFALTGETLAAVPYGAVSVVEDLEYHLALVRAGRAVRFVDDCAVFGEMPAAGPGVKTQRARWEGGRLRMIASLAPGLAGEVLRGRFRLIEPLLELLLLPLALHVALLTAAALSGHPAASAAGAAGLALVVFHVAAALAVGGGGWRDLAALASAPVYVAWKIAMLPATVRTARKNSAWIRTQRPEERSVRP